MTKREHRDHFMARCGAHDIKATDARALIRHAATLDRLNEAVCNGTPPAEGPDTTEAQIRTCPKCDGRWLRESFRANLCPDCRAENQAVAVANRIATYTGRRVHLDIQGDPRDYPITLIINDDRIGVPVGSR